MFIYHNVAGSIGTSLHDFEISINGMELNISNGSYFIAGNEVFSSIDGATLTIPVSTEITHYEIWLTKSGVSILVRNESQDFDEINNSIDRLAWFSVPADELDLTNVEIHVVKVGAPNESENS